MKILKSFAIIFMSIAFFLCGCLPEGVDIPTDQPTKKTTTSHNKTHKRTSSKRTSHRRTNTTTQTTTTTATNKKVAKSSSLSNIPPFSGEPYVIINHNFQILKGLKNPMSITAI